MKIFLLVLALSSASAGAAQAPVDFSGHWVLASTAPNRPGFDAFWLGADAVVTRSGTTLTITRNSPAPERKSTFQLDGSESENVYTIDGARHIKHSRTTAGATLLISTDTTTPDGKRWLSHINRWAIDAEGMLLVTDTQICGSGECPSVVTNLKYRKKSSS